MRRAAGARALLSATATLPPPATSTSIPQQTAPRAHTTPPPPLLGGALPRPLPHRRHALPLPCRGFHTTPSALASTPAPPSTPDAPDTDPGPTEQPAADADADARKEKLRSAGYGSARARAARKSRVEEAAPPLELPDWFFPDHLKLYEEPPPGGPTARLPVLEDASRLEMLADMEAVFDAAAFTEANVETWKEELLGAVTTGAADAEGPSAADRLLDKARDMHAAAFWQSVLLVLGDGGASPRLVDRLRCRHSYDAVGNDMYWPASELPTAEDARLWLRHLRDHHVLHSDPLRPAAAYGTLLNRPETEQIAGIELAIAVRVRLPADPLRRLPQHRPPQLPIILSVLNSKGRRVADELVDDAASALDADVLHLSAHALARLLAKHMGQNTYSSRGAISMLGYAAAEMNGRLAASPDPIPDADRWPRLRFVTPMRESLAPPAPDSRWDDLKIGAALETLVSAAYLKLRERDETENGILHEPQARDLIIHLHDYVEMTVLYPSIVHKLRNIAERMSTDGRRVAFVGSSSADMDTSPPQWQDQLVDLGRHGAHLIPVHAAEPKPAEDGKDVETFLENMDNIEDMLRALLGDGPLIYSLRETLKPGSTPPAPDHDSIYKFLSSHGVFEPQFVQSLVSVMVGSRLFHYLPYGPTTLLSALTVIMPKLEHWASVSPAARSPPYHSPITGMPKDPSPSTSPSAAGDFPFPFPSGGPAAGKSYTPEEKKLLSGLINANDIRTTFADIVVPQETKDSLIGLTTLSLVRPEAFSYGVLKTEHIPGCLLYGPPGTGKTLLAKAVAKESGANMLEVSAADINDKWVGQSEQNVQALFSLARKLAPCVIFLDEADALLGARTTGPGRAAHRETITQFLREWDGLLRPAAAAANASNTTKEGDEAGPTRTFIMVATNRPFDLDDAVLRRLPRRILVDLPLAPEREAILRVVLRDETLAADVDLPALARRTELYSGSDLKNMCVSAAMEAVREELRAKEDWKARGAEEEGEYQYPERRVLELRHFEKGLRDIGASSSGDMDSLKAIRKFDERYGDAGRGRKVRRGMGFEVVKPGEVGGEEGRVRQGVAVEGGSTAQGVKGG